MFHPENTDKIRELFTEHCRSITLLNVGYDNTNYVYDVATKDGECIVKILKPLDDGNSFWRGLTNLFAFQQDLSIQHQAELSALLNTQGSIPVPEILFFNATYDNPINNPFVVMDKRSGQSIIKDSDLEHEVMGDPDIALQLGEHLGKLHSKQYNYFGAFGGKQRPLQDFSSQLIETIKLLAATKRAQQDEKVQRMLPYFLSVARDMQPPATTGLTMLDLWPSQFLVENAGDINKFSALIDIESYVIAPIELELTLLELWVKPLHKFKEGYFSVTNSWPDALDETREIYRFFLYLLYGCPEQGLDTCLDATKFPQGLEIKAKLAPRPRPQGYTSPFGPGF